jgi:hypothetical protein
LADVPAGPGDPLSVIARRRGHHRTAIAALELGGQCVQGITDLERPRNLQVIELQERRPALGVDNRRGRQNAPEPLMSNEDVVHGNRTEEFH